jgi:hypothetical protein
MEGGTVGRYDGRPLRIIQPALASLLEADYGAGGRRRQSTILLFLLTAIEALSLQLGGSEIGDDCSESLGAQTDAVHQELEDFVERISGTL